MSTPTPSVGPHPEEYELADYVDGLTDELTRARVERHLQGCRACAALVSDAQARPAAPRPASGRLVVRRMIPESLASALQSGAVTAPSAGQLWRVRVPRADEADAVEIVAVVIDDDGDVLVAPVTPDQPELTDRSTVHLSLEGTEAKLAVWLGVARTIGVEALDVLLGSFNAAVLQAAHRATRRGLEVPSGVETGTANDDGVRLYRQGLADALTIVADCRLLGAEESDGDLELATAMARAGWTFVDLVQRAGMVPGAARAAAEGRQALAEEDRARISDLMGVRIARGGRGVPRGWQLAVATPLRRRRFENVARRRSQNPFQLRADVALNPVAARNSSGAAADWEALVEQRLVQLESEVGIERT